MYKLTEVKARLHTGGKTVEQIRERYTGQGLTYRNFESLQRAFDLFDGQEIDLYRKEDGSAPITYYVASWPKANGKIMDGVYEAEQTHPDRRYTDDKQKFMLDWLQGKYSAGMAFEFRAEDVEELETVAEEVNEPDPPSIESAAPPKWRQVKEKRARRKRRGKA